LMVFLPLIPTQGCLNPDSFCAEVLLPIHQYQSITLSLFGFGGGSSNGAYYLCTSSGCTQWWG
jgi:hypothetical protein